VFRIIGGNRSIAKSHVDRKLSYPHYTIVLNLADIEFPIMFRDIPKFENLNNKSIRSTCTASKISRSFLYDSLISRKTNILFSCTYKIPATTTLDTLLWIKNLSRLIRSQINGNENRKYFCKYNKKS